jgi:transposase-like protein
VIMKLSDFNRFLTELSLLTDKQAQILEDFLAEKNSVQRIINGIEQRLIDNPECPHCHSQVLNRHGRSGAMQRYRCKNCLKTFSATTGTPLARLRLKDRWLAYIETMLEGKVLRYSARECGINLKTAFLWRHRLLTLPAVMKPKFLEGIVEVDETLFAYSEKGNKHITERKPRKRGMKAKKPGRSVEDWVPVLTARDRAHHTFEAILPATTTEQIKKELAGKIEKDSVLCSDGFKAYIRFANDNDLIHKRLNSAAGIRVIEKVFHIQNVNAYHSRLKSWMAHFHGVATKYLDHYLGWYRYLDTSESPNKNELLQFQQQLTGT